MTAVRCLSLLLLLGAACSRNASEFYDARGTVEVPEVDLGAMSAARVIAVRVDEGARVEAGDTIALLSQVDLGPTLAAQGARIAGATANLRDLEAGARPEEVRRAEAEVAAATAELDRATKELARMRDLASRDVVSKQTLDNAVTAERVARARMSAAEEALRLLRAGARPQQIVAGRAELASARAALAQVEARAADLVLVAPVAGIVLSRNAEPGEALGPNVPVVTIGETARPYVRVFVPQSRVTSLAVGSPAQVVTEDGRTMPGRVVAINPKAEFTPRVALSEQERADLMFGVKVEFTDAAAAPHPGLWVTVRLGRTGGPAVGRTGSSAP
jgi:HlyD family secretion protein